MTLIQVSTLKDSFTKAFNCTFMHSLYTHSRLRIEKNHHIELVIKCIMERTH